MIEVERVSDDRLSRGDNESTLRVSYFARETRPTTRHKWRAERADRYDSNDPRSYFSGIKAQDVPLPNSVKRDAVASVVINVLGPTER